MGAVRSALVGVVRRFGSNDWGLVGLERALPVPAGVLLAGKLVAAVVFAAPVSLLLMLLGATVGKVVLGLAQWASLFILSVLGVIPFSGLGLSGLRMPLSLLSHTLAQLAPVWPAYHLATLTQYAVGAAGGEFLPHVLDLAGMGVLFIVLSRRVFRKLR